MTPKEKANELIEKFKPNVYCYYGSGMLTDTYDDDTALYFSKKCAIVAVDEIIDQWDYVDTYLANLGGEFNPNLRYWQEVKTELELKN